ncbi:MAG: PHA/PHB synthase family protein [Gemmatimonadota bacterium]
MAAPNLKLVSKVPAARPPAKAVDTASEEFLAEPVPLANYDRAIRAAVARASRGIAWPSLVSAWADWYWHLAAAPGKQLELASKAQRKASRFALYALECAQGTDGPCIAPLPQDRRFDDPDWQEFPFNLIYQSFLLTQQWVWNATNHVTGVSRHHERMVTFTARQALDVFSPTNFIWTNPEVLARTAETGGQNLVQGALDWWRDFLALGSSKSRSEAVQFRPGHEVAITPGKVVLRNDLIELIQYAPATETAYAQPVLIIPSPILKYYILDLSPHNSLVKYLVGKGHTVFMLSWRNPDARDRELGVDHYLRLGIRAAIDAAGSITGQKLHAVGYCLGGTFLAALAASMAGARDDRLATLTLLAAEVDFTEAGELSIFIDDSQLAYLEDLTWEQGYLDGKQMSGAFTLLSSNDLLWSRIVRQYLMAEPQKVTDLTAWNVDTTRLPHRMHTEYLRNLYLNNDLASGRMRYDGRAIALSDIRAPIFLVGTERDHVAPWKSVYMLHLYADADITFCLTSGGHNVGIVNPPEAEAPSRHYRIATKKSSDRYIDPDQWFARYAPLDGSWWPAWQAWLAERSGERGKPPTMGNRDYVAMEDAPGTYVLMK